MYEAVHEKRGAYMQVGMFALLVMSAFAGLMLLTAISVSLLCASMRSFVLSCRTGKWVGNDDVIRLFSALWRRYAQKTDAELAERELRLKRRLVDAVLPRRNCDRFESVEQAWRAFRAETKANPFDAPLSFNVWLFSCGIGAGAVGERNGKSLLQRIPLIKRD